MPNFFTCSSSSTFEGPSPTTKNLAFGMLLNTSGRLFIITSILFSSAILPKKRIILSSFLYPKLSLKETKSD